MNIITPNSKKRISERDKITWKSTKIYSLGDQNRFLRFSFMNRNEWLFWLLILLLFLNFYSCIVQVYRLNKMLSHLHIVYFQIHLTNIPHVSYTLLIYHTWWYVIHHSYIIKIVIHPNNRYITTFLYIT